uniref:Uncharacterized protein n=1 Tax=Moniliophthora roreri TaxID=221103 RepID=A0A0W0ETV5_MONRR
MAGTARTKLSKTVPSTQPDWPTTMEVSPAFPELKFPRSLEKVLSKYSIVATSFKSVPLQNPRKCHISSPGKDAETVATASKKAKHSGSTKPKPAPTNPQPKASQAMSSKTSPDETIVIKVEKGATPSVPTSNVKRRQSSKVATSHIIVSPPVFDKKDPLVALTSSKGKSRAAPPATDEEDELNTSRTDLKMCTTALKFLLQVSKDVLLNALNSVAQVADSSRSLSPLSIFLCSTTVLPLPHNKTLTPPCTRAMAVAKAVLLALIIDSGLNGSMILPRSWMSLLGLVQASSICRDITLYTSLLETQARLDEQLVALSHSINVSQDAFKMRVVDPRQILQSLLFLDPSFSASDAQVASLYPHDHGYELREVSRFPDSPFRIFVKGTNIDITGKKGSEWEINDKDLVVPTTAPDVATTAEASGSMIDASNVDIIAKKSAAVSSSTPLLFLRDSLIPMSFGPVSSLLRDDSNQSSDIWSLPSGTGMSPYHFLLFSICCLDMSSPSTTANASSEWTDHPGWLTDTHAIYDHCRESAVKPLLCLRQAAATQMCEQLGSKCKPLNFRHVAHSDEAYTLYSKAVDLIKELVKLPGVKEPFQLSAITHFLVEMDTVRAANKACGSHKSKKSSKVVEDGSDDDEVVVLTVPSEDTEMANAQKGLNASMHTPKPATTDAIKSLHFTKEKKMPKEKKDCLITSSSINAELSKVSKHPHLEHPIADLCEESPEEHNLQVAGADSVIRHTALVPFMDLEKMSTDVLLSVSNFLRHKMSTLKHNVPFFSSQYELTRKQFEEASWIRLSKLELVDKPMADAEVVPSPQETVAGSSNTASQVVE